MALRSICEELKSMKKERMGRTLYLYAYSLDHLGYEEGGD